MRPRALILALPLLTSGCGGHGDSPGVACAAVYAIEPVAAFAGHYSATFTPKGATAATRAYDLTVAADGSVAGTVLEGDVVQSLGGFSRAGNVVNGCDRSGMAISLNASPGTGGTFVAGETLSASRARQGTLVGSYPASLSAEAAQSNGTLVVANVPAG